MTVDTVGSGAWASALAERHLAVLGDRWLHTQAVARCASEVGRVLPEDDRSVVVAAAWLHDLGYGPEVRETEFHPLDGARHLVSLGADARLCALVAHHSGAAYEASERGLLDALSVFPRPDGPALDALIYADMTTGPRGQPFTFDQRIEEILHRYAPGDPVHRAITAARPYLAGCVRRTADRLAGQPRYGVDRSSM